VTYYLEVLLVKPNGHCFIYLGFTAQFQVNDLRSTLVQVQPGSWGRF